VALQFQIWSQIGAARDQFQPLVGISVFAGQARPNDVVGVGENLQAKPGQMAMRLPWLDEQCLAGRQNVGAQEQRGQRGRVIWVAFRNLEEGCDGEPPAGVAGQPRGYLPGRADPTFGGGGLDPDDGCQRTEHAIGVRVTELVDNRLQLSDAQGIEQRLGVGGGRQAAEQ
jgi:hypothetical protein